MGRIQSLAKHLFHRYLPEDLAVLLRRYYLQCRGRVLRRFRKAPSPGAGKLHLGSGRRAIQGWLNVDLRHSDFDLDLTQVPLPWPDDSFRVVVSQHVIEHLRFEDALGVLGDVFRLLQPGGELWVSCPDIEKICKAYLEDRMGALARNRLERLNEGIREKEEYPDLPVNYYFNTLVFQGGDHLVHYDFELLKWAFQRVGLTEVERSDSESFLKVHPDFPSRYDDDHAIYVRAKKPGC